MRFRAFLLALSALPGALPSHAAAQSAPVPRAELVARLDSLTHAWIADAHAAGVSVAVVRGSDTLLMHAYGERNRETHAPATMSTVYQIGSITKQFTAAAIMQQVERGKIALTDPLTKFLPQYPQWRGVTIRNLLNHTSGIRSYTSKGTWEASLTRETTPAQLIALVEKDTLDFPTGTAWRYNNTGYALLGMILEKVTGRRYADYVRSRFFTPLGMRSAAYCPNSPTDTNYAVGYDRLSGAFQPTRPWHISNAWSAGALCMTVPDYLTWQVALTSGRVVRPASFARMAMNDTLANGRPMNYGFALWPTMAGTHRGVRHDGGNFGFMTEQRWYPDDSLRVVVFSNTMLSRADLLAEDLVHAVFGLPLASTAAAVKPLPAAERPRYVGTYDIPRPSGATMSLRVFEEDGALMAQAGEGGKLRLDYVGDDTFTTPSDPTTRFKVIFENGVATRASLTVRGQTTDGPRRP